MRFKVGDKVIKYTTNSGVLIGEITNFYELYPIHGIIDLEDVYEVKILKFERDLNPGYKWAIHYDSITNEKFMYEKESEYLIKYNKQTLQKILIDEF